MVTKYSTEKYDLEHYALSDEVDVFFKSLPPFSENGHLFLSIFEKRPQELKKRNIIAFGRARGVGIPFILFLKAFHVIFKYKTL
jgi:hypothetical protein